MGQSTVSISKYIEQGNMADLKLLVLITTSLLTRVQGANSAPKPVIHNIDQREDGYVTITCKITNSSISFLLLDGEDAMNIEHASMRSSQSSFTLLTTWEFPVAESCYREMHCCTITTGSPQCSLPKAVNFAGMYIQVITSRFCMQSLVNKTCFLWAYRRQLC